MVNSGHNGVVTNWLLAYLYRLLCNQPSNSEFNVIPHLLYKSRLRNAELAFESRSLLSDPTYKVDPIPFQEITPYKTDKLSNIRRIIHLELPKMVKSGDKLIGKKIVVVGGTSGYLRLLQCNLSLP